jgi:acetylornithine deacetylase/succinyl-diaminopimelate desuccinylase-like protein
MALRRDALAGAAEMIAEIRRIGTDAAEEGDMVATVGDLTARDAAMNKINGNVSFPLDVRSCDGEFRSQVQNRIDSACDTIADKRDLEIEREFLDRKEPVTLDDGLKQASDDAADRVGVDSIRLPSGGGHDAMNFAFTGVPTGMIFTPSTDGISHHPDEHTDLDAISAATRVLAETLRDATAER